MLSRNLVVAALCAFASVQQASAAEEAAKVVPTPTNQYWWPDHLDLSPLRAQAAESNPMGQKFNYAEEFKKLDLKAIKKDLAELMTRSQDWWPADYGNYGPFFIRMAWHSAGTYRTVDGRGGAGGGQQRFEPLNSWPDNANLDKARRLVWPIKKKYGKRISWADLMVLTGNVALESMGFQTIGFGGGRVDQWEPDLVYWGPESKWMGDERFHGERKLDKPMGAAQMGLIYVNPEGPKGSGDPMAAAHDIRETFGRMAMSDEETVALIAGGHTFGKAHGNGDSSKCVGPEPAGGPLEDQGLGWKNKCGAGVGADAITSGLEGAWSATPTRWSDQYFKNLFAFNYVKTKSPAGATQWIPENGQGEGMVPDAHLKDKRHPPIMFTTDLSMKLDPKFEAISKRFQANPEEFRVAFAKAWFKLTHRDMGPKSRYLGAEVPKEDFIWQDPVPAATKPISAGEIAKLKSAILASGVPLSELVRVAWASAASFRGTDKRGGANGARIRLAPEKDWAVNEPAETAKVLARLESMQKEFNKGGKKVSLADLIVLGGAAAVEKAAKAGGFAVTVPFTPGRTDATQEQTDVEAFAALEPRADAFRNYYAADSQYSPTQMLVERSAMLKLTVPEMTALVGGMRVLQGNSKNSMPGVLTTKVGTLNNDFFVNLLDMSTKWQKSTANEALYEGLDRKTNAVKWTATPVDLIFGSHSELRAIAEVYATEDGKEKFVKDFVAAWSKVMMLDRFDVI